MNRQVLLTVKILLCLTALGVVVFGHIDRTNELTEMRREIPKLEKELRKVELENARLQFEVDQFESPAHLLELARKPEFGHLKFPSLEDVLVVEESDAN